MKTKCFTLRSEEIGGQGNITMEFNGFGCGGKNISPALEWINSPSNTKSFAITMFDADAPTGSGWWHWLVFNIPSSIHSLSAGAGNVDLNLLPNQVVQSKTDYNSYGYGGPCPPEGDGIHQYIITVYALNCEMLDLNKDSNPALVGFQINANTIKKASLVFYYKR